jgi:hypothetical protein
MSKQHIAVRKINVGLLCLTAILITPKLYAGDEDMSPSVYQQFDPVTGYMITVESPPAASQNHAPAAVAADVASTPPDDQAEDPSQSQYWVYLLAVMLLGGGFVAWFRNKRIAVNDVRST